GGVANPRKEYDRLFWNLPLGVGLIQQAQQGMQVDADALVKFLQAGQLVQGEPEVSKYKEVKIHKLPINAKVYREAWTLLPFLEQQRDFAPFLPIIAVLPREEAPAAIDIAAIEGGILASASEEHLKKSIDQAAVRKKPEEKPI